MSDYTDIIRMCADQMVREGKILGAGMGNTTANTADANSLTVEKLQAAMRLLRDIPPRPAIDLYSHELGDQCYILTIPKDSAFWLAYRGGRQIVVVPEKQIDDIYHQIREAGIDVRFKPRFPESSVDDAKADQA